MEIQNASLTEHARRRMQQRGVQVQTLQVIVTHYDRRVHCGGGCIAVHVTRPSLNRLIGDGVIAAKHADSVAALIVVIAGDGAVVSVYPRDRRSNRDRIKRTKSFYHRRARRQPRRARSSSK